MGRLGEDDAGGVGTHMARDAGQHIGPGAGVQLQIKFFRRAGDGQSRGECKGRAAELDGVDAEEQVMHDGVADQHHLENVGDVDAALLRHILGQGIQRLPDGGGHFLLAARVHHHVGDAAHQVFAEADLRVHQACRGRDLSRREIGEMGRDGGGAHVDGDAEGLVMEARPDRDEAVAAAGGAREDGGGDLPLALAQHLLQVRDDGQVAGEIVDAPLLLQRFVNALEV